MTQNELLLQTATTSYNLIAKQLSRINSDAKESAKSKKLMYSFYCMALVKLIATALQVNRVVSICDQVCIYDGKKIYIYKM